MCVPDFDVLNITKRRHALNRRRIVDIFTQLQLRVYLDQEQNKPETNSHNDSFVKKAIQTSPSTTQPALYTESL